MIAATRRKVDLSGSRAALFKAMLKAKGVTVAEAIAPRRERDTAPLSFAQERMWFLQHFDRANCAYNITIPFRIAGKFDPVVLEQCLRGIRDRHEILRTTFEMRDGQPVQRIHPPQGLGPVLTVVNAIESQLPALIAAEHGRAFDLETGPLFRTTLFRLGPEDSAVVMSMHHIVSDGWSTGILFREMAALAKGTKLEPLAIQYGDFAVWQRDAIEGEAMRAQVGWWRRNLDGAPEILELPLDHPRPPAMSLRGSRESITLPAELAARIRSFSEAEGVTPFMTLLAAWSVLLGRYSGQSDVVVATPIANRRGVELEPLIGLFMNVLPMRTRLDGEPTFRDLVSRVREAALGAYAHQDVPFTRLVEELAPARSSSYSPLAQAMFVFQNTPDEPVALPGIELRPIGAPATTAKTDLTLYVEKNGGGLTAALEYATDLFETCTIRRMLRGWRALLEAALDDPAALAAVLPLLDPGDRTRLLHASNPSASVHALFEEQARRSPDAVALAFEGRNCSYRELDEDTNRLANYLRACGAGPETLVGVCLERSAAMVKAVLAVLKAGAAYVPLDPAYPAERIAMVMEDAHIPLLVTEESLMSLLPAGGARVVRLDGDGTTIEGQSAAAPEVAVSPHNLAYVIFTSGSTGRPKGVQVTHGAVVNFLRSMIRAPGLSSTDILAAVTTLSFDIAGLELFLPLAVGGRIELIGRDTARDGLALDAALRACGATCLQATPATYRLLIEAGWKGSPHLKVLCGGEAMPGDLAEELLARCGSLWNMYGPTETTIWSTIDRVTAPVKTPVSIGRPIDNTSVYVLDANFEPAPAGVVGDLYIGGDGVARGYLNRPDLTADRFVPDPFGHPGARVYRTGDLARYRFDGSLEFLGRSDHQVKIRGFRVELGEVEEALSRHPSVRRAAVTAADRYLAAYVVLNEEDPADAGLREFLKARLPEYMVPSVFVRLDAMPLTPNGKIDRRALPAAAPPAGGGSLAPPETATEIAVARIFAEVLHVDAVGRDSGFFELGGHSLLIARLLMRVREECGIELPVRTLFEAPTVAALGAAIDGRKPPQEIRFEGEAVLDPEIQGVPGPDSAEDPKHVLLTGATGFLGVYLLHELLERTDAEVTCLVRGGLKKIWKQLKAHGLWRAAAASRIHALPGDLSQPLLGLDEARFEELAGSIDAIYHNGASVNFFSPYGDLKAANVLGTQEVLRLASRGRRKAVHYVSTLSVRATEGSVPLRENDPLVEPPLAGGGYPQSKWVAERLIGIAQSRGIPAAIYRPGTITGHSRTGACNPDDFLYRFLRGCLEAGSAPAIDMMVDLIPVDYVSAAIVQISRSSASHGRVFHLASAQPTPLDRILEWTGIPLDRVPYSNWRGALDRGHPLASLAPFFPRLERTGRLSLTKSPVDCTNTLDALDGSGIACPEGSEALVRVSLEWLSGRRETSC